MKLETEKVSLTFTEDFVRFEKKLFKELERKIRKVRRRNNQSYPGFFNIRVDDEVGGLIKLGTIPCKYH